MEAKEEAEKLVEKFIDLNNNRNKISDYSMIYYQTAKKCAILCVDAVRDFDVKEKLDWDYLYEVRQEIEKL